jgi:hypothetical protein
MRSGVRRPTRADVRFDDYREPGGMRLHLEATVLSMSSLCASVYARIPIFYYSLYQSTAFRCQLNGRAAIQE